MSLLLVFFVLLFAFSHVDRERFYVIMSSFQGAMGIIDGGRTITEDLAMSGADSIREDLLRRTPWEIPQTHEIIRSLEQFREQEGMESAFAVEVAERGIILHFTEGALFDLGSAELRQDSRAVLRQVFDI